MPASKPNQVFRVVVPLVLVGVVLGLTLLAFNSSQPARPAGPAGTGAAATTASGTDSDADAGAGEATEPATEADAEPVERPDAPMLPVPESASGSEPDSEPAPEQETEPAPAADPIDRGEPVSADSFDAGSLRARVQPVATMPILGSLDPASGHFLQVALATTGAGIEQILATNHFVTVADRLAPPAEREHYVIQQRTVEQTPFGEFGMTPMATLGLLIGDQPIDLHGRSAEPVWRVVSATVRQAVLESVVVDGEDRPVLTVRKTLRLDEGTHLIRIAHDLVNHTDRALNIRWLHYGPLDMPTEQGGAYGGAVMRLRFGYLLDPRDDPSQTFVEADRELQRTMQVVGRLEKSQNVEGGDILWPDPRRFDVAGALVWFGQASRYFATVVLPEYEPRQGMSKALDAVQEVTGLTLNGRLLTGMISPRIEVQPGSSIEQRFQVYAGPISREDLSADANPIFPPRELNLRGLLVYNYGGPCASCTFQWLASPLLTVMRGFHVLTRDWALAIIMLVLVVRTVLHPITRKAQVSMLRFGKQMQKIAPKQQKLREKYKNDPKQMQTEVAKLMREEGVNPVGMLGCLPMFLQTPVWIALYAMLGFAIELRHEPAFYGFFQFITGNGWQFLADLSMADGFIPLGTSIHIPGLSSFMGPITSINILPLLLGVVFYVQQKYLAPPTSGTLTPEQETQQKMIKVMMVVMFPVFIYNAPSGLALYFITNSTIAIFESRWIRKSAEKMDLDKPSRTAELLRKQVENRAAKMKAAQAAPKPLPSREPGKKRFKDR